MSTNKARPHAELMKLYAEDAAETDKPWKRWQLRYDTDSDWRDLDSGDDSPVWCPQANYRRKPTEPTILQGHTMEQWGFIMAGGFDCEFSAYPDFELSRIATLVEIYTGDKAPFEDSGGGDTWNYCRPRRAKGVKQPWFGGVRPVSPYAQVYVFHADGKGGGVAVAGVCDWGAGTDIIAFIEL